MPAGEWAEDNLKLILKWDSMVLKTTVLGVLEVKEVIWEPWVAAAITSWSCNEGYFPQIILYLRYNLTHEWVGSHHFSSWNFGALLSMTHTQEWSGFWMNSKNRCHLFWSPRSLWGQDTPPKSRFRNRGNLPVIYQSNKSICSPHVVPEDKSFLQLLRLLRTFI